MHVLASFAAGCWISRSIKLLRSHYPLCLSDHNDNHFSAVPMQLLLHHADECHDFHHAWPVWRPLSLAMVNWRC